MCPLLSAGDELSHVHTSREKIRHCHRPTPIVAADGTVYNSPDTVESRKVRQRVSPPMLRICYLRDPFGSSIEEQIESIKNGTAVIKGGVAFDRNSTLPYSEVVGTA